MTAKEKKNHDNVEMEKAFYNIFQPFTTKFQYKEERRNIRQHNKNHIKSQLNIYYGNFIMKLEAFSEKSGINNIQYSIYT